MIFDENEQSELRRLMYQDDDIDEEQPSEVLKILDSSSSDIELVGKFVVINLNGKQVRVPSLEYVNALEKKIVDQGREISRINSSLKMLRQATNKLLSKTGEIDRELANKINMRELP